MLSQISFSSSIINIDIHNVTEKYLMILITITCDGNIFLFFLSSFTENITHISLLKVSVIN